MEIFNLPDLGEGLPDAEIHAWFVQPGDSVEAFQPLVSMETAKALVDVPCPRSGIIKLLHGKPGDVIKTGAPLVEFSLNINTDISLPRADQGTVVGHLEENAQVPEDRFTIVDNTSVRTKITPNIRLMAKKLGVDLSTIVPTGEHGLLTQHDVEIAAKTKPNQQILADGFEPLHSVRRAMYECMIKSHQQVVPVSIFDLADISQWPKNSDITVRLIRALTTACKLEPTLNAWFDGENTAIKYFNEINLGLAMDNAEGLFVPVINDVGSKTDHELRTCINQYKKSVQDRTINAEQLKGATFCLSNFGKFAGRFAGPIIVPPMVAIIAVGRSYNDAVVTRDGNICAHPILPLSLSFDHRAITGGEATRFLGAFINALQQP